MMFARNAESAHEGGVTGFTSFAARVRWCLRALGFNPLVRGVDRIESLAVVGVVIAAVAVVPVAVATGEVAHAAGMRTAEAQAQTRHSIQALVTEGVGLPTDLDTPARVTAQWTEGTHTRTEQVVGPATIKAGDHMTVWLDDAGKVVTAPLTSSDADLNAVAVGVTIWVTAVAASALIAFLVRRELDRLRDRAWEREIRLLAHNDDGWANRRT